MISAFTGTINWYALSSVNLSFRAKSAASLARFSKYKFWITGSKNDAVLPLPVSDRTIMSYPKNN